MDLLDLLKATGGGNSIGQLAKTVGLGSSDTSKLIASLAPALMGGLQKNASGGSGLAGLQSALQKGGHNRYIDNPDLMGSDDTRQDGNKILGHLFGGKSGSRDVATAAASDTGIDASLIKKALPLLATLAMGAMNKKSSGGSSIGGLGSLLGLAKKFL
jgi:hypothetical protein